MNGVRFDFSEADLAATVKAYDPALHEAPLVIGHPKHDAPAAGWVKSLTGDAQGLTAEPQQVDPAFAELLAKHSFKKSRRPSITPMPPTTQCQVCTTCAMSGSLAPNRHR